MSDDPNTIAYLKDLEATVARLTAELAEVNATLQATEESRDELVENFNIVVEQKAELEKLLTDRGQMAYVHATRDTIAQLQAELAEANRQLATWEANEPCPECGEDHKCGAQADLAAAHRDVNDLNEAMRRLGWGQGEIDSYAACMEKFDHAEAERASLTTLLHQVRAQLSNGGGVGHIIAAIDERVKP